MQTSDQRVSRVVSGSDKKPPLSSKNFATLNPPSTVFMPPQAINLELDIVMPNKTLQRPQEAALTKKQQLQQLLLDNQRKLLLLQ